MIGPVTSLAAALLGSFFTFLGSVSSILLGAVVGGLWQILVMFGLHWALVPLAMVNMGQPGGDPILAAMLGTTFAQTGAVLAIIISAIALIAGFILVYFTYKDDEPKKTEKAKNTSADGVEQSVSAPVSGRALELSEVKDEVFSSGSMGKGIAVEPEKGEVYAPCDGEIVTFFPTGHAIGIKGDNGAEILIHVGIDTVELNGEGFTPQAKQGDHVKKGQLLLKFDIGLI